ncbi:recombinase family protein [Fusobacterium gastrosuis]|uniref:recombinase family protein n=1 Tax=Fusobacterium gastrosuis TaxID=1755100 RepID=UPI002979E61C|nr:recombinase family protein [Fusobacteriaceae bacterium]MDY5714289.1 recombinase family protein [Fusobacterium gastrosuis]
MKKYGYIRVSSNTQDETRQKEAMIKKSVLPEDIFLDKASGKNFIDRSEWGKMLAKVVIGDVIVIKELDRLGRNNDEIKENYKLIKDKGVFLEFIDEPILNTYGKSDLEIELIQPLVLHLLGYIAEKEREKILKRQKEAYSTLNKDKKGRLLSRKKGKVVGRPNKVEQILNEHWEILNLWINGKIKSKEIREVLKISESTLYRIKQELKEKLK